MALHREIPAMSPGKAGEEPAADTGRARLIPFFKAARIRRVLLWMVLVGALAYAGLHMRMALLSDLGFGEGETASLMLRFGYPFGLLGTVAGAFLLRGLGARTLLWFCGILATGVCLLTVRVVAWEQAALWAVAAMIACEQVALGGAQVLVYTVIMASSAGHRSGAHYAALCSSFHLIFLLPAPLVGMMMDRMGYGGGYAVLAVVFPVFLVAASFICPKIGGE
jgi:predicted MFS family arabinose efflux permease